MNLQEIIVNSKLSLEQQFTIVSLAKMDLNEVTKEQLLETLVQAYQLVEQQRNLLKEIFKQIH